MLRANLWRRHKVHKIGFFILLVANIGGSLTPLGDPPLFLGFLKGVDFFWPTTAMFLPMLTAAGLLIVIYYIVDQLMLRREDQPPPCPPRTSRSCGSRAGSICCGCWRSCWRS